MEKVCAHWGEGIIHATQALRTLEQFEPGLSIGERHAVSHLRGGSSIFLIDGKRSEDFYLSTLSKLIDEQMVANATASVLSGPLAIILVATRRRLLELRKASENVLFKIVCCGCSEETLQARVDFLNNCDLLIVTPIQLVMLLETQQVYVANRLCYIVLDNFEQVSNYEADTYKKSELMLFKLSELAEQKPQIVVTMSLWQKSHLAALLAQANKPVLIFNDMLEAAAYGQVAFHVELLQSQQQKIEQLLYFLTLYPPHTYRTLIYCSDSKEMSTLSKQLPAKSYLLHRGRQDKACIEQWQQQTNGKVLILSAHSPELQISNVQSLIHFNMPSAWCQFKKRFAAYGGEIPNLLGAVEQPKLLQTLILLDDAGKPVLPHFTEFMHQHQLLVSDAVSMAHVQLQAMHETSLVTRHCVLCPMLLLYGHCRKPFTCQYRHRLAAFDVNRMPELLPSTGCIRFAILKICTPTHYAVRLMGHRAAHSEAWRDLPQQQHYIELQRSLHKYYANPEHRVPPSGVQIEEIYVRRVAEDCYERVCITCVQKNVLRVKYLDSNTAIFHIKPTELLVCPAAMQQIPPLALDVRIAGFVPYNGEPIWQSTETELAAELLGNEHVFEATVEFSLAHTIFVEGGVGLLEQLQQLQQRCLAKFEQGVRAKLQEWALNV